jgi:hypothetical protein
MLAKMGLNVRLAQYGFELAMPAVLVCAAMLLCWIPREVKQFGGNGAVVRAVALLIFALLIAVHLRPYAQLFHDKPLNVGTGMDVFRCGILGRPDPRGIAVNRMLAELEKLPPSATLATVPEGVMLNYLSRRTNPTRYTNLMPPEVVMFGQDRILQDFKQHPPDYIVIVRGSDPSSYGYKSFAADYGAQIFQWIMDNYQAIPIDTAPEYPLMLMKRKEPQMNADGRR